MRRSSLFLAGIFLALLTFVLPQGAHAATDCDQGVIDMTSERVLDTAMVDAASSKLERDFGADVRVRAFQSAPEGSLDAYYLSMVQKCASWRGVGSQVKGNLIVYMFSIDDRLSAIKYGGNYTDELDGDIDDIRNGAMADQFRKGDFTAGVVEAHSATADGLKPSKLGTYVLIGFGVLLGIALLVGMGFLFVRVRAQRRVNEHNRLEAQARAIKARDKASEAVGALSMESVNIDYQTVTTNLNDQDKEALKSEFDHAHGVFSAAINAESARSDRSAGLDPEKKLTTPQYESVTADYDDVYAKSIEANRAIVAFEAQCKKLLQQIAQAPEQYASLMLMHRNLTDTQSILTRGGYRVDEQDTLNKVQVLLAEAKRQIDAKQYGQAIDELSAAQEICDVLDLRFNTLKSIRSELLTRQSELMGELEMAEAGLEGTHGLEQLKSMYDESCWRDVAVRRNEVEQMLILARENLGRAEQCCSMESQDWETAQELLESAASQIGDPEEIPTLIEGRLNQLQSLAATLPDQIVRVVTEANQAENAIRSMKGSHGGRKRRLQQMEHEAQQLSSLMAMQLPELLAIRAQAALLSEEISKLLSSAKAENRRIEQEEEAEAQRKRREEERRRRNASSSSYSSGYGGSYGGSSSGGSFGGGSSGSFGSDGGGSSGSW